MVLIVYLGTLAITMFLIMTPKHRGKGLLLFLLLLAQYAAITWYVFVYLEYCIGCFSVCRIFDVFPSIWFLGIVWRTFHLREKLSKNVVEGWLRAGRQKWTTFNFVCKLKARAFLGSCWLLVSATNTIQYRTSRAVVLPQLTEYFAWYPINWSTYSTRI